ncbi:GNAT family N-acetyltransferase [Actinokineospora cianjurensis]|uniref:GNAT family N-acetyltransferase n=1 Tax=Actinokineospora cianjurensis TaxID=585224 RepID=UPI0014770EFD|nr:GNAT family N-acetyltransferase [Actinokineospora cianjurensis]
MIELTPVALTDKALLSRWIQTYLRDTFGGIHAGGYPYLDQYFTDPDREAHFIVSAGDLAGFVLARVDASAWTVAEFYVAPWYRRQGIARAAALAQFARHPGPWTVEFDPASAAAAGFWHSMIPAPVSSVVVGERIRLSFTVSAPL